MGRSTSNAVAFEFTISTSPPAAPQIAHVNVAVTIYDDFNGHVACSASRESSIRGLIRLPRRLRAPPQPFAPVDSN